MNEIKEVFVLISLVWNSYRDLRDKEICLSAVAVLTVAGISFQILEGFSFVNLILGTLPGLLMLGISIVTRGGLGLGDGLVALSLGICIGCTETAVILVTALFLSAFWAGVHFCFGKKGGYEIPFLPFILFGYIGRILL
mgnify:CR=1 FL=1